MISQNLKRVAVIGGLFLGAFTLSAIASEWAPATCAAPGCNTEAPINTGSAKQYKIGPLAIGKVSLPVDGYDLEVDGIAFLSGLKIGGDLQVLGHTQVNSLQIGEVTLSGDQQKGYVLTKKDGVGNVEWRTPSASVGAIRTSPDLRLDPGTSGNATKSLGTQSFCALASEYVFVRTDGNFNQGDGIGCSVSNSAGAWTLSAVRSSGNTDVGIICRAVCFGGGEITP